MTTHDKMIHAVTAPYVIGDDNRELSVGERIRADDEMKSGMNDGQWKKVPSGFVWKKVDGSLTIRRKKEQTKRARAVLAKAKGDGE